MNSVAHFFSRHGWWVLLLAFSIAALLSDALSGRFQMVDLEVYYRAAQRMVQGLELYRVEGDGFYVYKYAPSAAFFFIPLTWMPFGLAKVVYWWFLTGVFGWVLTRVYALVDLGPSLSDQRRNTVLLLSMLPLLMHVHSELHLGQVNLLLLGFYVLGMMGFLKGKSWIPGLMWGASVLIKPFALIFLPYILIKKRWKTLGYYLLAFFMAALLPLIFYPSFSEIIGMYNAWWSELLMEMGQKQDLLQAGNHTVFSVLARYTPVRWLLVNPAIEVVYQMAVLIGFVLMGLWMMSRAAPPILELCILVICIPLFAATSKNAFIFSLPLVIYLVSTYREYGWVLRGCIVLGLILMGGNQYELMGKALFLWLDACSVYTLGALLLLWVAVRGGAKNKPISEPW